MMVMVVAWFKNTEVSKTLINSSGFAPASAHLQDVFCNYQQYKRKMFSTTTGMISIVMLPKANNNMVAGNLLVTMIERTSNI